MHDFKVLGIAHPQRCTALLCQGAPRTPTHTHTYAPPARVQTGGRSRSQRTPGGGHTPAGKAQRRHAPPPPPRAEGRERRAVKRPTPPPPQCNGTEQALVPFRAHGGAAWPHKNGMLITGSSAGGHLSKTASPQTHAGLPLYYGVVVVGHHTHTHTHVLKSLPNAPYRTRHRQSSRARPFPYKREAGCYDWGLPVHNDSSPKVNCTLHALLHDVTHWFPWEDLHCKA